MAIDLSPIHVFRGNTCYSFEFFSEGSRASIIASASTVQQDSRVSELFRGISNTQTRFETIFLVPKPGYFLELEPDRHVQDVSRAYQNLRDILEMPPSEVFLAPREDTLVITVEKKRL